MWLASEPAQASPVSTAVTVVLLVAASIFVFGYRVAVNRRANSDYKKTKAALPDMRKSFWRTWWAAVKVGFWMVLIGAVLLSWAVHDARQVAGR